ncbi:MAG: DUF3256 family protein [Bacteroidaceae bacterium]|nr:DUF3256 family protein [Bacteroidaceae bacterium]
MKRILLILFTASSFFTCFAQQPLMREVFATMPDSIAPMVSRNNRLDCIDYIENNMEARVRNVLDEYVTLEALTADYARFRTSTSVFLELKLLPQTDSTSVLCMVRTAQTGEPDTSRRLEDSNIRFFKPDWTPLDSSFAYFTQPQLDDFILSGTLDGTAVTPAPDENVSTSTAIEAARRSLQAFHPIRLTLSADDVTLIAELQLAYLATDERTAMTPFLRPQLFRWNGIRFIHE